ncbi:BadF/BadG/BcrA/BcrD ATPase family protein [Actinomadura logoneensis]|uniref:BadF/BadG/BcrA/BcrD ATPase family protein n=1 Tax=Actinomadura logoneensis TaxID=2293572 RepID=UPI001F34A5A7|nr:BadF/BadG/BcrA/BcrD ATPase family protein [Actinomadura logoneensis]
MLTLTGALAGTGTGPGANPNSGGDTAGALTTALSEALGDVDPSLVLAGVFGIAGAGSAGRPAAVSAARRAWQTCGLRGSPAVVTDIAVAFAAGTSAPKGIVVFSGTGAGAAVISDGRIVRRADGYGWLVGDEGSAVWLGREAVRAALAALDGRSRPTLLTESVPRALLGQAVLAQVGSVTPRHHRTHHRPAAAPAPALAFAGAMSGTSPGPGGTTTLAREPASRLPQNPALAQVRAAPRRWPASRRRASPRTPPSRRPSSRRSTAARPRPSAGSGRWSPPRPPRGTRSRAGSPRRPPSGCCATWTRSAPR